MKRLNSNCLAFMFFLASLSLTVLALPASGSERHDARKSEFQPLYSRYAQTVSTWTLRGNVSFFKDAELQEATDFDGTLYEGELTIPFNRDWQLRLYYPFSVDGEGRSTRYGKVAVDIEGDGGTLDFPSLIVDYQFRHASGAGDYNLAACFGAGTVFEELESRGQHSAYQDIYNHRGSVLLCGLKADREFCKNWDLIGNLGVRYYWDSDDLHPCDEDHDKFWLFDVSTAVIYKNPRSWLHPALELVFQGDLNKYNSLQIVPQLMNRTGIPPGAQHRDRDRPF